MIWIKEFQPQPFPKQGGRTNPTLCVLAKLCLYIFIKKKKLGEFVIEKKPPTN